MKLLLIAGARPNFMKVAPLIKAIQAHNCAAPIKHQLSTAAIDHQLSTTPSINYQPSTINYSLIHTGQHYDEKMSDVFFRELGIPAPDINLGVGSGSHAVQTANIMLKFEPVLQAEKPDWLVVVGDVNSTMACTLVASKLGVKVAHVEAGLRSFDRTMPEEINRIVTDSLADLLLTPSEDANDNLRREGVPPEKIRLVGNIMIDSLMANLAKARQSPILQKLNLQPGQFSYVTLHRPGNVDDPESLSLILGQLKQLAAQLPVVFPVHPRTRKMAADYGLAPALQHSNGPSLRFLEPIGYHDSLCLAENARLILTDSGGLQEESTFFRTPCLTLRPNTERPITITLGSNRLTTLSRLPQDLGELLHQNHRSGRIPPMWDGHTADRVLDALCPAPLF